MMGNLGQSGMMQVMMSGQMPDMSQMMGGMGGGQWEECQTCLK